MSIQRWNPVSSLTRQEQMLMKRLGRTRKLFGFLRLHRHELFDEAFQTELAAAYRDTGAGKNPTSPAMMAMAMLLQGYVGASDAEAVELTVVDLRWQMVLGRLGRNKPAFSQGSLFDFRRRLIENDLDRRVLERTVEVARKTKEFDWRKLPKTLRVAIDSSPLVGAGRVEDTFNLLGHAARKIVVCVSSILDWTVDKVCREAGIPMLLASSVKRALDVQWSDPSQKASAFQDLIGQLDSLEQWLTKHLRDEMNKPPLDEAVKTLLQIRNQDLEPDPTTGGTRIRDGVAEDRRVSIEDPDMRHGRKSKSKLFNGYKRHIATDLDSDLILACGMTPANRPEDEAIPALKADIAHQGRAIHDLFIDRGYINSPLVDQIIKSGGNVHCRPWVSRNGELFSKNAFTLNMRDMTITCPAGQTEKIALGTTVEFDADECGLCLMRKKCTTAKRAKGRTVAIAEDERLHPPACPGPRP